MKTLMAKLSQLVLYVTFKPLLTLVGIRFTPNKTDGVVLSEKTIVAANHLTLIDFMLVSAAIRPSTFLIMRPFVYMAANYYMNIFMLGTWMRLNGSFPVKEHKHMEYGIRGGVMHIKQGRPLVLFPEGKRAKLGIRRVRTGIEVIATEVGPSYILPISINMSKRSITRPIPINVVVGNAFSSTNIKATEIMQIIKSI